MWYIVNSKGFLLEDYTQYNASWTIFESDAMSFRYKFEATRVKNLINCRYGHKACDIEFR